MTGNKNYLVRYGFSESDVWLNALGNSSPLLANADSGYCIDAPTHIPAGAMQSSNYGPMNQTYCRNIWDQ